MEKEKTEVQLSTEDCINVLRNLQYRTKGYVHLFPEMGKEVYDTWAAIDKEALERAIQALQALAAQALCSWGISPGDLGENRD